MKFKFSLLYLLLQVTFICISLVIACNSYQAGFKNGYSHGYVHGSRLDYSYVEIDCLNKPFFGHTHVPLIKNDKVVEWVPIPKDMRKSIK